MAALLNPILAGPKLREYSAAAGPKHVGENEGNLKKANGDLIGAIDARTIVPRSINNRDIAFHRSHNRASGEL